MPPVFGTAAALTAISSAFGCLLCVHQMHNLQLLRLPVSTRLSSGSAAMPLSLASRVRPDLRWCPPDWRTGEMAASFKDKGALVTGGSRGIGRAIAEKLGMDGAAVAINYVQRHAAAQEVVDAIRNRGGKAVAIQADVSQPLQIRRLYDEAQRSVGSLDIVVANAAVAITKPVIDCNEDDFNFVLDANTKGVFFVLQEAVRRLRDNGRIGVF
jgi:FlaA1/EpsC-like NDP-sugar epimerase